MNKRKICIIMHNDLMDYPPMISLIDIMKELGEDITYILVITRIRQLQEDSRN